MIVVCCVVCGLLFADVCVVRCLMFVGRCALLVGVLCLWLFGIRRVVLVCCLLSADYHLLFGGCCLSSAVCECGSLIVGGRLLLCAVCRSSLFAVCLLLFAIVRWSLMVVV